MRKLFIILSILIYFIGTNGINYFESVLDSEIEKELDEERKEFTSNYNWTDEALNIEEQRLNNQLDINQVISKYESQFNTLKSETLQHIEQIKEEVLNDLDEETNPFTLGVTILKYEKKADQLEKEIDKTFNDFFQSYLSELRRLGYTTSPVNRLERQYTRTKRKIKNELVQEANAWIEDQKRF